MLLLQRKDILASYVETFQELRTSGNLFDVTLACEDETVEAHKVVVSACSPFFRHLLTRIGQAHPFIYMKGVLHKDLMALLDYIYTGETQVAEEDLDRFFETAKELKIQGLIERDECRATEQDESESLCNAVTNVETVMECNEGDDELTYDDLNYYEDFDQNNAYSSAFEFEDKFLEKYMVCDRLKELKQKVAEMAVKVRDNSTGTQWECKECGKLCKKKSKLEAHIETHFSGFIHTCKICGLQYKTRNVLRSHISAVHKGKKVKPEYGLDYLNGTLSPQSGEGHFGEPAVDTEQEERLQFEISKRMQRIKDPDEGVLYICTECGKQGPNKYKIGIHVETHLEGFSHACVYCDKIHKTRGALKTHISTFHRHDPLA